jgi:hypothetical protein
MTTLIAEFVYAATKPFEIPGEPELFEVLIRGFAHPSRENPSTMTKKNTPTRPSPNSRVTKGHL